MLDGWKARREARRQVLLEEAVLNLREKGHGAPGERPEGVGEVDQSRLRRVLALGRGIIEVLKTAWLAVLLFLGAYFIAGLEWALVTALAAEALIYVYTSRIYVPPGYLVVVMGMEEGTLGFHFYNFPKAIFECVNKEGVSNAISTKYGMAYLAEGIEWDAEGLPAKIRFAWVHYTTLNFALKMKLFHEMRATFEVLYEENHRQRWLLETLALQKSVKLSERHTDLIAHAHRDREASAVDIENLRKEVEELRERRSKLRMDSEPGLLESVTEEADAPL
jgi:hypothetical protein